ncbi:hypothetical protein Tco_1198872, partial [Tanacetum coccineum]
GGMHNKRGFIVKNKNYAFPNAHVPSDCSLVAATPNSNIDCFLCFCYVYGVVDAVLDSFNVYKAHTASNTLAWACECGSLSPANITRNGLDLPEILVEVERRGSSFAELLTIPEQVDWIYVYEKSTSCIAFILKMYKEAGLFGDLADNFQVTVLTVQIMKKITRKRSKPDKHEHGNE